MKILICYFSGTGNTLKVVKGYEQAFINMGCVVGLVNVEKEVPNVDDCDMFGIAYPIHAFNAPKIILDFAKTLAPSQQKKLFIIKTSGEPLALNNSSSTKLMKILKKRNFVLTNEYHYVMPYNMIFRHSNQMAYKMWDTAQRLIPIDAKEILQNKNVKLKKVFCGDLIADIFRIEHWGARFNGKKYKVDEKCVSCKKCVNNCPVNNITFENGKFKFGKNCTMCMRCSFMCPTNAIKIGLFNSWKVNGVYKFDDPNNSEQKKHKNWCKKAYEKYFERSQQKIDSSKIDF